MRGLMIPLIVLVSAFSLAAQGDALDIRPAPPDDGKKKKKKDPQYPPKSLGMVRGFEEWITSLAFSPDGKFLAVGTFDRVKLIDAKTRKEAASLKTRAGFCRGLVFSNDSATLICGCYQKVLLFDVAKKKRVATLKGHRGYITAVALSKDGKQFATSSLDQTIRVWDLAKKETVLTIKDDILPFQGVAYSPDGRFLAAVLGDADRVTRKGYVRTYSPKNGERMMEYEKHLKVASSATFSPDGSLLVSTSDDEKIHLYDVKTSKAKMYSGHSRPTNACVFAPDGRTMISGSGGRAKGKNEIAIWDRTDGRAWALFEGHKGRITSVALHRDGKTLATAGYDKMVKFWDLSTTWRGIEKETGYVVVKKDEKPKPKPKEPKKDAKKDPKKDPKDKKEEPKKPIKAPAPKS